MVEIFSGHQNGLPWGIFGWRGGTGETPGGGLGRVFYMVLYKGGSRGWERIYRPGNVLKNQLVRIVPETVQNRGRDEYKHTHHVLGGARPLGLATGAVSVIWGPLFNMI